MNELKISMTWKGVPTAPGTDADGGNPLARALSQLLRTGPKGGQPSKRLTPVFLTSTPYLRWFGVFVFTVHGRVLFFPGVTTPGRPFQLAVPRQGKPSHLVALDHITLESDLKHWHVTAPGSSDHLPAGRTYPLESGASFWFGWAVRDHASLRELHAETIAEGHVPGRDAARRIEVLRKARDGADFPLLDVGDVSATGPNFLHFSVIVGRKGFPAHRGETLGTPGSVAPDAVRTSIHNLHPFEISPELAIQVTAARFSGQLRAPMVLTKLPGIRAPSGLRPRGAGVRIGPAGRRPRG